jgi:hypothetical protein
MAESVQTKSIGRGQKIVTSFGQDNCKNSQEINGKSNGTLGGSVTNLSHSLSGASVSKSDGE